MTIDCVTPSHFIPSVLWLQMHSIRPNVHHRNIDFRPQVSLKEVRFKIFGVDLEVPSVCISTRSDEENRQYRPTPFSTSLTKSQNFEYHHHYTMKNTHPTLLKFRISQHFYQLQSYYEDGIGQMGPLVLITPSQRVNTLNNHGSFKMQTDSDSFQTGFIPIFL